MTTPGNAEKHVQLELGLYVLGALSPADRLVVDQHLRRCSTCRAECAEIGEVPAFLGLLSLPEVEDMGSAAGRETATAADTASELGPRAGRRTSARRHRLVLYAITVSLVVGALTGVWFELW